MSNKLNYFALNSLPPTEDLVVGGIYYLNSGEQYIVGTGKSLFKISDIIFTDNLPLYGTPDKLYIHSEDGKVELKVWTGLEYFNVTNSTHPIKNTFIFFTNHLLLGEIQTRAKIPYDAKITKLETILTNQSDNVLSYSLEKSTDGINFTQVNINESISAGEVLNSKIIIDGTIVDKDDILRLVLSTNNEDVNALTVNITIEEI